MADLQPTPITVAHGDGIGPEIMDASLKILQAAGANIAIETIEIGEKVFLSGNSAGIAPEAWDSLRKTKVFYKAPITTPQGGGFKSLNVTTRKMLSLYANIRPCVAYHPYVDTKYPAMDLVIIRENEEDLYAGIEHQQTDEVIQCLKLISRPGCEKIVRYAFEYARQYGRKKVTCFTKDNIMKQTDGLFHKVFDEIGAEYPDIEQEHWIIDIGSAKLADTPEIFDVIVTLNLYGDIISDIAAQIAGSVGLAGSANIGPDSAMFEAIHGSAPRRAGQNLANPSGLLLAGVQMLVHIDQPEVAEKVHNAWLKTLEDGVHTYDIFKEGISKTKVGTKEFAEAVIERLGKKPSKFKAVTYTAEGKKKMVLPAYVRKEAAPKQTIGTDVFIHWGGTTEELVAKIVPSINTAGLELKMISNRGIMVWPSGFPETFCTDHWRLRFMSADGADQAIRHRQIAALLDRFVDLDIDFIKTENLCTFNGKNAFSLGQGQ
ncbi:MAG: NADP-dependent isocitrate dehydrogenase [Bacteroidetes bacterium]|nr:MAG: NADP-dependent isocitrate dehydrogenase [Bacteroidota bacterium]